MNIEKAIEKLNRYKEHILKCGNKNSEHFKAVVTILDELEKYKQLYNKALSDTVTTAHDNIKKDKMIDLMLEHICNSAIVDDTVCAIRCDCETDINEECTYEKMLNCTREYFERKAKDGRL